MKIAPIVLTVGLAGGCSLSEGLDELERAADEVIAAGAGTNAQASTPAVKIDVTDSTRKLGRLVEKPRRTPSQAGYDRDEFGTPWSDIDRNGCNQRDDVLLRDAVPGTAVLGTQGRCEHDVLGGEWIDPYTGAHLKFDDLKSPRQSQAIQIDHIVPLAEAWVSGANKWDDESRRQFANSFDVLLSSDGPANMSKGASDPAGWKPRKQFQCEYATRWINIKTEWKLTVDPSERKALAQMLEFC